MRLDQIAPGSIVTLSVKGSDDLDTAMLIGVEGEGEDRTAKFAQVFGGEQGVTLWEAYRYNGRWACGSGADRLSVVSVDQGIAAVAA